LIEYIVNFKGDSVVKGDLSKFIHLLNIFILGCYLYVVSLFDRVV